MSLAEPLFESSISSLPLIARGKVRDIYEVDDEHLLIVTTDRLSAYDVVLPDPVPFKGEVLTQISSFWFELFTPTVNHHMIEVIEDTAPAGLEPYLDQLRARNPRHAFCESR